MRLYQKSNPIGIDYWVKQLQDLQERDLPTLFGIPSDRAAFYPRVEKVNDKLVCFISGNDSHPVGWDDRYYLMTYVFIIDNGNSYDGEFYCHANLQQIYNDRSIVNFKKAMTDALSQVIDYDQITGVEIVDSMENMQPSASIKINFKITFYYE